MLFHFRPGLIVLKIIVQFIFISLVFSLKDLSVKSFVQLKLRFFSVNKFVFKIVHLLKKRNSFFKIFRKIRSISIKLSFFLKFVQKVYVLCLCFSFVFHFLERSKSFGHRWFFLNNTIIHKTFC